jgi:hypothetical protein
MGRQGNEKRVFATPVSNYSYYANEWERSRQCIAKSPHAKPACGAPNFSTQLRPGGLRSSKTGMGVETSKGMERTVGV